MTTPEASNRSARRRRRWLRYFVMQFLPVTAGVLTVLLIDSALETSRQRALVDEAQAALAAEVARNAQELGAALVTLDAMKGMLATTREFVDDILNTGRTNVDSLDLGVQLPNLNHAGWNSAERSGALGYMQYAEVTRYAELYALQQRVEDSQRDLLLRLAQLGIIVNALESGDPEGYMQDLQASRRDVAAFQAALALHAALAGQLAEAYRQLGCAQAACTQDVTAAP